MKIAMPKGGDRTRRQILNEADFLFRGYAVEYEPCRLSGGLAVSTASDS
jgi:hypothetical protein